MYYQNTENNNYGDNDVELTVTDALINRLRCQKQDELNLSLCNIVQVPLVAIKKYFGQPKAIDLSFNSIRYLGSRFALELANVTKLDLSRNGLEKLPNNFGVMKQLVYLDVHQNKLTTLPLSFGKLTRLQYLSLTENPFHKPLQQFLENAGNEASGVTLAKLVVALLQRMDSIQIKRSQKVRRDKALTKRSSKVRMELLQNAIPEMEDEDEQSYASSKSEPEPRVEKSTRNEFSMRQGQRQSDEGNSLLEQVAAHATSTPSRSRTKTYRRLSGASVLEKFAFQATSTPSEMISMTKPKSDTAVKKEKPLTGLFSLLDRMFAFVAIWTVMFPIFVAYNVETAYLEHMAEKYPAFGEIWTVYQHINRWAQYVPYYFPITHNSPWVLRGPPPPTTCGFFGTITDFFCYIGHLLQSFYNYIFGPD